MQVELQYIPVKITGEEALSIINQCNSNIIMSLQDCVYYPYLLIITRVYMKMLTREIDEESACLVDMVKGAETTTNYSLELTHQMVDDKCILPLRLTFEEARSSAINFLFYKYAKKFGNITTPIVSFVNELLFYKIFWIVNCTTSYYSFYVIVDSITGEFHPCYT